MARRLSPEKLESHDKAQLSILNLIQAILGFKQDADPDKIIDAVGDAKSPDAVSRAARERLPADWFNKPPKP